MMWQHFVHATGWVRVLASTELEARAVLARNAWNKLDPGWPYAGAMLLEEKKPRSLEWMLRSTLRS